MIKKSFKLLFRLFFKLMYRVEVDGIDHYRQLNQSDQPAVIVANHVSLLDGPLLAVFLSDEVVFMVDETHTHRWYEKFLLGFVEVVTVKINSPFAAKHMIELLKQGKHCVIFPEGKITTTGSLMKVYEGPAMVALHAKAAVLPIFIDGAQYSKFSYLDGSRFAFVKQKWFPKIRVVINKPVTVSIPQGISKRDKHQHLRNFMYLTMRNAQFLGTLPSNNLTRSLFTSRDFYGHSSECVNDINHTKLSRSRLVTASIILGNKLSSLLGTSSRAGILLPNVSAMPTTFFALQFYGLTPALLNFTAGLASLKSACITAEIGHIITSRKFVETFDLQETINQLDSMVAILYLEDIKSSISLKDKVKGIVQRKSTLTGWSTHSEDEAVVLFTSGSEGTPKGVVLSHKNLLSNVDQISAMLTLIPGEQMFNALPTFHSFGLTAGVLWPILKGTKVFLYPSPLHYAEIPEIVYQLDVKMFFGTDTFFSGYARKAHPYDFYSIKALVAGAEKLKPETRQLYAEKFNVTIYEGYGVTETSPVLSVNTPLKSKIGTVGQFVPSVDYRLDPVEGIKEGGRLFVCGPNVMKGYLKFESPGVLIEPANGWHDTGDIVTVDAEGFITITGRAKRFAKIGGEMISLSSVENYINQYRPEFQHAVVSVKDDKKGEKLIVITTDRTLAVTDLRHAAKSADVSEISIPKIIIFVEALPVLGTGKVNYPSLQNIAEANAET